MEAAPQTENTGLFIALLTDGMMPRPANPCYRDRPDFGTATVQRSLGRPGGLWQSEAAMTITYANGTMVEGIALVCTDGLMRVALRGCRDSVEFVAGAEGTWLSESGEPVQIGDHAPQLVKKSALDDFICPQDVMERLMSTLQADAGAALGVTSAA
jgi:hypothetical protein